MNLDGRVIAVNRKSRLAAADIGFGKALVFEFQPCASLDTGDLLENLYAGYSRIYCENVSRRMELNIQVLAGALPENLARLVVGVQEEESPNGFWAREFPLFA